ncbi:hypothetical protein EGW08_008172 [Elysia chlorotica]|uniref:Histone deacetylase domain-containing protein n=1 Tax=Elysia chlorotica TaxID=188477 RepID=A0A3S1BHI3_ELYCH|nr:hypothetical protein EGW08_008172 [Elysia chlorotica]
MAAVVQDRRTAVVFDKRLESHFSRWNVNFTETPHRVAEILKRCNQLNLLERCLRIPVREATVKEITTYHTKAHLDLLESTASMNEAELKEISQKYDYIYFHEKSAENAKLSLGGVIDLIDAVVSDKVRNGMAIVRPPGHHAMKEEYCGYCYLGNVSIAAQLMLNKYDLKRILVLDWDVHHGQGTQYMFYDDPRVLFVSIHRYEHGREWPHLREGDYDFTGEGTGKGYNINVPLNEIGCDNSDYLAIMFNLLLPIFYQFDPELVLVSAGFDCAIGCPEGEMMVSPACFAHFINLLKPLAKGKLALILEGGYNLKSLSESTALSLRALLDDPTPLISPIIAPKNSVTESILNCIKVMHQHWSCLQYQDFVEPRKVRAEIYPYQGVLHLPPVKDVEFYTSQNRPKIYPLIQDCANDIPLHTKEELDRMIEQLVQNTSLLVPKDRLGFACENGSSAPILGHLRSKELWAGYSSLQTTSLHSGSASDCIKTSMDSILSNEVRSCLCCLQSEPQHPPVNGKPMNGNSHAGPSLVNLIQQHAIDSKTVNRIVIIDLCPDLPSYQDTSKSSSSVLYISLRVTSYENEEPHISPGAVDIPLSQAMTSSPDFIAVFLQIVMPIAYEFCPELVFFKLNDMKTLPTCMDKACLGHITQQLLGLANGRMIILTRDAGPSEETQGHDSTSSGSSEKPSSGDNGSGESETTSEAVETKCGQTEAGAEVLELLEECVEVVAGASCKRLQADPPSESTASMIRKSQDKLKEFWSVLQFRVQLPIISV